MVSWLDVGYVSLDAPVGVDRYVSSLQSVYLNGKVRGWVFDAASPQDYDRAFVGSGRPTAAEFEGFLGWFLRNEVIEGATDGCASSAERLAGFACEGELTQLLCDGGAHASFSDRVAHARNLSFDCMLELFGENLSRVRAYILRGRWCEWFNDSGWDTAVFATGSSRRRWWVLFATDFD